MWSAQSLQGIFSIICSKFGSVNQCRGDRPEGLPSQICAQPQQSRRIQTSFRGDRPEGLPYQICSQLQQQSPRPGGVSANSVETQIHGDAKNEIPYRPKYARNLNSHAGFK